MSTVRALKRKPARSVTPRTVTVQGTGEFEDWECVARADFSARILLELDSGEVGRILAALDKVIVSHNFPDMDGELAESLLDVDPYEGVMHMAGKITDALGKLPNR